MKWKKILVEEEQFLSWRWEFQSGVVRRGIWERKVIDSSYNNTGKNLEAIGTMWDVIDMKMYFKAWQRVRNVVCNGFDKLLHRIDSLN